MGDVVNPEVIPTPPARRPQSSISSVMPGQKLPASYVENAYRQAAREMAKSMAARELPRNIKLYHEQMEALCKNDIFAEQAVYRVPVGGKSYSEGPSVYLARAMASRYHNFEWEIIEHSLVDGEVQYEVRAWDIEHNITERKSSVVRLQDWVIKGGDVTIGRSIRRSESITEREVLLKILPGVQEFYELAQKTVDELSARIAKHAEPFLESLQKEFGADQKTILASVNLHDDADMNKKGAKTAFEKIEGMHIRRLKGMRTAILSGSVEAEHIWAGAFTPDLPVDENERPVQAANTKEVEQDDVPDAPPPPKTTLKPVAKPAPATTAAPAAKLELKSKPAAKPQADADRPKPAPQQAPPPAPPAEDHDPFAPDDDQDEQDVQPEPEDNDPETPEEDSNDSTEMETQQLSMEVTPAKPQKPPFRVKD